MAPPLVGLPRHDSDLGQFVEQPDLESADPGWPLFSIGECAGLFDELAQLHQLRLVQREVGAVGKQQVRLPGRERGEHADKRNLVAFNADRDTQVEPVCLAGHRVRRHRDDEGATRLPVVHWVADHLQRDIGKFGEQRLNFGGESHCLQAGKSRLGDERAVGGAEPELLQRRFDARGECLLRFQVAASDILRCADRCAKVVVA